MVDSGRYTELDVISIRKGGREREREKTGKRRSKMRREAEGNGRGSLVSRGAWSGQETKATLGAGWGWKLGRALGWEGISGVWVVGALVGKWSKEWERVWDGWGEEREPGPAEKKDRVSR